MASKGKPSPRSAVKPLSDAQVAQLAARHRLVDPTHEFPTGPRKANQAEINAQNPKATKRLLAGVAAVFRASCRTRAWGLEHVPEEGVFITAATHVTMFDVFVPMMSLFHMGRRPRYMAKAEMAKWPLIGKWFQLVGMQPVERRSGKARAIEETSIEIITNGRPLTVWPEGTVTRDPQKWPMSMKNGVGVIALEASRRLGRQVPLFCAVTWGAASINHWWPWPRKNVVMCYDNRLDYADLLADQESWGDELPQEAADELIRRIRVRMTEIMAEIRGEQAPDGYWDYRTMRRVKDA
ncbi:MAG: lysophospholipid acyltransferase family protein [Bifidobacterium scardovii]|uniref:lysophospholipid acyltransferase family protein n=1 Tax=Bifidobacterium scardovii TaxID=158787 RepID=UPI000668B0F4|nr:lysophospholipid acyltransferase family protein [Bifidobacterium scardovii]MBS6947465.1 1-acyl-sn-glycerol-3-phosphate acyltransferase [Bifidobacterium scardovii]MDU3736780.1 lysophospholipid acyltransferase family protein [Bifidobacterium scardovii]MDU5296173.1 lysophospholipid acyltransferase family protein [Bifidobacterium scardovii]MDU5610787.1 lysophospholipid acyltransferase family protein [Bifidobacterium scardovii]MDU5886011.1 lysophospholipid acyltransferase family protein [Bifidob